MDTKVFFNVKNLNTLGDYMKSPSNRKIARRPYREFEYMPELQKQNSIKDFLKKMYQTVKDVIVTTKPSNSEKTANVKKNSTIERNGAGTFFEA